ncbi:MAG: hypothetical protein H0T73_20230 [Ardenticatenales bacterium]|nr:hypothetical protein [Ardenticatenales bacterium]
MHRHHSRPPRRKQPPKRRGSSPWNPRAIIVLALVGAVVAKFLMADGVTAVELWGVIQPAFWVGVGYYLAPLRASGQ